MSRDNRPKMKGGFDFFNWYSQNKNKVTKFGNGGIVVEGAKPAAAPKPTGTNMGTGDRTAPAPSSGNQNRSGVTPIKAAGASSPSYRAAVEKGSNGNATPSSGNAGSGRGSTRTSPTGVQQSGTNTGFKGADTGMANQLLESLGISTVKYGQFESNKLPADKNVTDPGGKVDDSVSMSAKTTNQVNSEGVEGESELLKPTEETNIVNQGAQLGSRERYRNEFMKDRGDATGAASESMVGLRAAEASKGLLYASGKYWQEDGSGGFKEIDKATFKSIKRGDTHAQQFANGKIDELTANLGKSSVDYTVTPEQTPTQGTDIEYAVPDPADVPENGSLPLTDAQIPTQRLETLQKAAAKRKK